MGSQCACVETTTKEQARSFHKYIDPASTLLVGVVATSSATPACSVLLLNGNITTITYTVRVPSNCCFGASCLQLLHRFRSLDAPPCFMEKKLPFYSRASFCIYIRSFQQEALFEVIVPQGNHSPRLQDSNSTQLHFPGGDGAVFHAACGNQASVYILSRDSHARAISSLE